MSTNLFARALASWQSGRHHEAEALCREAIVAEPTNTPALLALGGAALAAGSPLALSCYEQVLSLQPTLARAHAGRGLALVASRREMEAIDALAQAMRLDPEGVTPVFIQAGYQMLQLGHPDS